MNITDPAYWRDRIDRCGGDLQRAMFEGNADQFGECHRRQMNEVQRAVRPADTILDVGCGYGRLLTMLPSSWSGWAQLSKDGVHRYTGVDASPDLIKIARVLYPRFTFIEYDYSKPFDPTHGDPMRVDLAVAVWLRKPLYEAGLGATWQLIEDNMRRCAERILVVD